ncbi:MAG TPA: ABC transporter ATP-binding protein, partial [Streptomyces sp.]|nr:ABC transporter ATP-binding protein [Streptomyces sp.]
MSRPAQDTAAAPAAPATPSTALDSGRTDSGPGQPLMLQARGVRKSFGQLEVLRGIDMDVAAGE